MACTDGLAHTDTLVEGPEVFELTLDVESSDLSSVEVYAVPVQITINDGQIIKDVFTIIELFIIIGRVI